MRGNLPGTSKTKIFALVALGLLATAFALTVIRARKGLEEVMVENRPSEKIKDVTIADHFRNQTPINILLLGYAGANHDGALLTDSMMVVQLDLKKKVAHLISLPRDIWIKLPIGGQDGSYWKINAAYAIGLDDRKYPNKPDQFKGEAGGGTLAKYAVEEVTGLPIDRFVAVDFKGFEKAIDLLGGVDVNVEKTFEDPEYPVSGRETDLCGKTPEELPELLKIATLSAVQAFPCRFETLRFEAGPNHLDGPAALKFARSRHSLADGSDFARANRQRQILVAVKERVVSLNFLPKILPTLEILKNNFRTDFSVDDLKNFLDHAAEMNGSEVKNLALTTDNVLSGGYSADRQYILMPNTENIDNWRPVHEWLLEKVSDEETTRNPIIKVENGTRVAGLADLAVDRLRKQGFLVIAPGTAAKQNYAQTVVTLYNSKIDEGVLSRIKNEFKVGMVENVSRIFSNYDLLVILGRDYLQEKNP